MTLEHPDGEGLAADEVVAPCAICGHADSEHTVHEAEEAGQTVKREYCLECQQWHDFVPVAE